MPSWLRHALADLDLTTKLSVLIIAVLSGVLNYAGMAITLVPEDDAGWWKALAGGIALGVAVGINLGWLYCLATLPYLMRAGERVAGFLTMAVFCTFLLGMSSWWNTTAMAWLEAKALDLREAIGDAINAVAYEKFQVTAVDELLPELRLFERSLADLRDQEALGMISGVTGCEGVCNTIKSIRASVGDLILEAEKSRAELPKKIKPADDILSKLRPLAEGEDRRLDQRFATAGDLITSLNGVLSETRNFRTVSLIRRRMEQLTDSTVVAAIGTNRQSDALARILGTVRYRALEIAARAKEIEESMPAVGTVQLARRSAMASTVYHFVALLPQWITGIGLDLLGALIVILRSIAFRAIWMGDPPSRTPLRSRISLDEAAETIRVLQSIGMDPRPLQLPAPEAVATPGRADRRGSAWKIKPKIAKGNANGSARARKLNGKGHDTSTPHRKQ